MAAWKLKSGPSKSTWGKRYGDAPREVIGSYDIDGKPTIGIVQGAHKFHLFDNKAFTFGTDSDFNLLYSSDSGNLDIKAGDSSVLEITPSGTIASGAYTDLTVTGTLTANIDGGDF
jgi:hypothetical protein